MNNIASSHKSPHTIHKTLDIHSTIRTPSIPNSVPFAFLNSNNIKTKTSINSHPFTKPQTPTSNHMTYFPFLAVPSLSPLIAISHSIKLTCIFAHTASSSYNTYTTYLNSKLLPHSLEIDRASQAKQIMKCAFASTLVDALISANRSTQN